jgi:DNA segregation ATPase FtsK/SpoIIIE, S-DNA-T family
MTEAQNTLKKEKPEGKDEKKPRSKAEQVQQAPEAVETNNRQKYKGIAGLLLMLFSVYMFIAFTSFLFTWKYDYAQASGSVWNLIFDRGIEVENWLGKLGALVSHLFIYNWFGISSYLFVLIFFVVGVKLFASVTLLPIRSMLKQSFFWLVWGSLALGFIFYAEHLLFLGGAFGYTLNLWMASILGKIGTGFLLTAILISYLIIAINMSFEGLFSKKDDDENEELTMGSDEKSNVLKSRKKRPEPTVNELVVNNNEAEENFQDEEDVVEPILITKIVKDESKEAEEIEPEILLTPTISEIPVGVVETTADGVEFVVVNRTEETIDAEETPAEETTPAENVPYDPLEAMGEYDPTADLPHYKIPPLELLKEYINPSVAVLQEEISANRDKIIRTLKDYGIDVVKMEATIGPTVTLYEIIPKAGTRISTIKNLENDIMLSLAATGIRIIAPIPGRGTIGIEVPNQNPEIVSMRSILGSEKFQNTKMDLPIGLGKTISNETFIADLAKMPHLLMAGATGQGKSVGINAIITSLLYKKHPAQLKFVLVDPKKVELTLFNTIERHFLAKLPGEEEAIITDVKKVVKTLNSLCMEMDQRYDLLKDAMVRNIKEYNAKFVSRRLNPNNGHRYLPYIVLVVDEFADLIMTAGREVETPIARLAQLARAIGIHLIIATQRPSVNIITGLIKANFPARIAFKVTQRNDSRTILDNNGAEQLIGRGDLLLSTGSDLTRIQCAFIDTPEVSDITEYIGSQTGYTDGFLLPDVPDEQGSGEVSADPSDRDAMFEEAAHVVVQHQQGSTSLIQRKLKLGYNRAGRIIDQLESAGIVGSFEGAKAREVKIKTEADLEQLLNSLRNNSI